jgi:putative zinc finger/helix-turn-helix YgiT family protein
MKGICPFCEKKRELELIQSLESIKVRGDMIEVKTQHLKCLDCENTFDDPRSDHDPLEIAYKKYRKLHEMIQPEEIKSFRKRYGLTQAEFSGILGWGIATLNRYENGALQSESHEKTLRLSMDPTNFLKLIEEAPVVLSEEKRKRLIKELQAEEAESYSFGRIIEIQFGRYNPDEFSGYRKLELAKLFNAILFFCKGEGEFRTKLNKLLFYADFKHYKEYSVSITGAHYAHLPHGPALNNYDYYYAELENNNALKTEEVFFDDHIFEKFVSSIEPDLSVFSESDLEILILVKKNFSDYTARKIRDFSHDEKGYKETLNGELISYKYGDDLQI